MDKPVLAIDFEGAILDCRSGSYGEMVPGFLAWSVDASRSFRLLVVLRPPWTSSEARSWLREKLRERVMPREIERWLSELSFADSPQGPFLSIGARNMQFRGDWTAWWLQPDRLMRFGPWWAQGACGIAADTVSVTLEPGEKERMAALPGVADVEGFCRTAVRIALERAEESAAESTFPA